MPKISYIDRKFSAASIVLIQKANEIIEEYQADGYLLTLRQLYYQFVARDLIPNRQREYKRLGSIINDARMAGLIDWAAIEDRGRNLLSLPSWDEPADIVRSCASQFRVDLWEGQPYRPEVWIEKEALIGVVARVCDELRVPHFACKGYVSQSEMWAAGHRRFRRYSRNGQSPYVIHLGDHDPSGIDMSRDIIDRLMIFAGGRPVELERIALNMDQVDEWQPPPNPAKVTDSRFEGYRARFGDESWELDALEPATLSELVEDTIRSLIDLDPWERSEAREDEARGVLSQISDNWAEVAEFSETL
jgi:serine/threonine protein kinase